MSRTLTRERWVILALCIVILGWFVYRAEMLRHDARLAQAKPKPAPVRVDTVYVARYWGMTFWSVGKNGSLVVEFQRVPKGGK